MAYVPRISNDNGSSQVSQNITFNNKNKTKMVQKKPDVANFLNCQWFDFNKSNYKRISFVAKLTN